MKTLSILFGLIAIVAFISGLHTLLTQPFTLAITNDKVFAGMFVLGNVASILFMWTSRLKMFNS